MELVIVLGSVFMWFVGVGIWFLNVIYFFIKLVTKQKKKIFFLSRQSNNPSIDFRMLIKEIEDNYSDYKIVVITKRVEKRLWAVLSKNIFLIFRQMYHLATCKVCVIDGYNISVSVLQHRDSMKVIQIWHSLAAIKKFGYQSLNSNRKKKLAKVMKMHKNYDYIISGSDAMTKYFAKAFNYEESKFYSIGLPRIDYLLERIKINRNKIYKRYPEFRNKKIILYAPTFRDNNNYQFEELIKAVDINKYILVIKKHPNILLKVSRKKNVYLAEEFTTLQLLSVADFVITDYSAVAIEAAVLDKPIYLYVYDYLEYSKSPGVNVDLYKELPGYVFEDANKLFKVLSKKKYDLEVLKKFKKKYVCNVNGDVTKRLARFIIEGSEVE